MTRLPRSITSAAAVAQAIRTRMPWERGLRREGFIRRRGAARTRSATASGR